MSPNEVLGVPADASSEDIRAAYLNKVKEFPPDRFPDEFEKIRDAFDNLRDPRSRAKALLKCPEARLPLASILDGLKPRRNFAGPQAWRAVLKTK